MKKISGIVFFMVCCISIILCLYGLKEKYSDLRETEEDIESLGDASDYDDYDPDLNYDMSTISRSRYYELQRMYASDVQEIRKRILMLILGIILFALGIYYVLATKFGREISGIKSIEIETKIIKLQIEKKELLARLEALEKNG
jgi:Ca2+/Na+ antiporter